MSQLTIESFRPQSDEIARLNNWIFETIQPYIKGRVLEMNSGQGDFSLYLVEEGITVQLNASSDSNREYLQERFRDTSLVRGVHKISFLNPRMEVKYLPFQGQFSTVLALNTIENNLIFDKSIIDKAKRFLRLGGHLIIIGQAENCFYPGSELDLEVLKKYNQSSINRILNDCQILITRFFNWNELHFLAVGRKLE